MNSVSPTPTIPTLDERRAALMQERPDLFAVNSKYAPKLTFADRCACYAYWKAGVERRLLSAAFGINRGTVNFIVTPSAPHYKNVRKEFIDLGPDEFGRTYMSDEWDQKIREAKKSLDVTLSDDQQREMKANLAEPNSRANSKAGEHAVFYPPIGNQPGQNEKVEVSFGDFEDGATLKPCNGWHVITSAGKHTGNPKHCATSAAALKAYLEDNMAELVK